MAKSLAWLGLIVLSSPIAARRMSPPIPRIVAESTTVVLLGTGAWNIDQRGAGPGTAVVVGEQVFLFDAGAGIEHQLAISDLAHTGVDAVFLSNLGTQNTLGLATFIFTSWGNGRHRPLRVYGPPGTQRMIDHLLAAYSEDIAARSRSDTPGGVIQGKAPNAGGVDVREISAGIVYDSAGVRIRAIPAEHWPWTHVFAFRIDTPSRSIVIAAITRPCAAVEQAATGVDVLVHNVYSSLKANADAKKIFPYMLTSDAELGALAERAHPKLLVLTHILPTGRVTDAELIDGVRKGGYQGRLAVGHDLDRY